MISGTFRYGIIMFKGVKGGGFEPSVELDFPAPMSGQFYKGREMPDDDEIRHTNPTFGDFNGDGLLDAFMGGAKGIRVSLNIGTKSSPKFGARTPILRTDGKQVTHLHEIENAGELTRNSGNEEKIFVYFVDWDNDKVNDLITIDSNDFENRGTILFHKGVKSSDGYHFEKGVAVLKVNNGEKPLPGNSTKLHICDYNNDGRVDILIGTRMQYNIKTKEFTDSNYKFSSTIEQQLMGAAAAKFFTANRDKGWSNSELMEKVAEHLLKEYNYVQPPYEYKAPAKGLSHRGYVIVLKGKK